jgi:hypothetical protein
MSGEIALLHQLGRKIIPVTDRSHVVYLLMEVKPTEQVAQVRRLCCKNAGRNMRDRKPCFLFSLGGHSKQVGDEGDLLADVSFVHSLHLPFSDPMHCFLSLECFPCRVEGKEAHAWFDQTFDETVILFNQVIQVFNLPEFNQCRKDSAGFELDNGLGIGCVLLHVDHARSCILCFERCRTGD